MELVEALGKAMWRSGRDIWNIGDDLMPPCVPAEVVDWLADAPPWPAYRPAREAWLTACVFSLSLEAAEWRQGSDKIEEAWARECVSRFLQMAGLLHPSSKTGVKLVDDTFKELQRLPWPRNRLAASEDPISGWVRSALELAPSSYVATAEIFAVWQHQNPDDPSTLKEFGERLAKVLLAWQKAGSESGIVTPIKNISRSCCREYPRNQRPRGWGGLTLRRGATQIWRAMTLSSLPSRFDERDESPDTSSPKES